MTAPPTTRPPVVATEPRVAAPLSMVSRIGPGPGLVVVALGLLVVGLSARPTSASGASSAAGPSSASGPWLPLPGALPPVTTGGAAGLGILLAVLLAADLLPRLRDATRVLLSTSALAAAGLGLVVLGEDGEGRWPSPSRVSELLGLAPVTTATVVTLLAPVVVHLAVLVVASVSSVDEAPPRARFVVGSAAGVLALVAFGAEPVGLTSAAAGAAVVLVGTLLAAHLRARRADRQHGPDRTVPAARAAAPGVATARRTDLLPAAVLAVGAVVAGPSGAATVVGAALAVIAVTSVSERLARWRARGQLEVLARCLSGTALVCVALGLALQGTGPRTWAGGVAALTLAGLALAARLPRPPSPQYVRRTHVLVLRGLPWALLAVALVVVTLLQPRSGGSLAELTTEVVPASSSSPAPSPSANPSAGPSIRLGAMKGTTVQVVVRAPRASGPLEIRTRIGGDDVSYPLVWVTADTDLSVDVALPERGRFLVTLNDLTSPTPLQTLVVER